MRIVDLLKKDCIELGVKLNSKSEAIDKLVDLHNKAGNLVDAKVYKEGILQEKPEELQLLVTELQFHTQRVKLLKNLLLQ